MTTFGKSQSLYMLDFESSVSRYRAMAVKKTGTSFVCYLLDFGNMVTISQTNMRPLPSEFLTKPPCAFQVKEISGKMV